jgi:hypothetical protein
MELVSQDSVFPPQCLRLDIYQTNPNSVASLVGLIWCSLILLIFAVLVFYK